MAPVAQDPTGAGAVPGTVGDDQPPVYVDLVDPDRQSVGLRKSGRIRHIVGREEHEVRYIPRFDITPPGDVEAVGGLARHLADGVLQGQDRLFANITAE